MNAEQRAAKLKEIIEDSANCVSQGVALRYQGETRRVNVYKIPLEFLIYNKYNGRISSSVKAYEYKNHPLNPENTADAATIEKYLWDSKPDRNRRTMDDIVENGQLRHGIVTADGTIIDGNRRASLLNRAYRDREQYGYKPTEVERCRYFLAVILPQSATPRDIQQLETTYQMGEDDKLDYNPIEKYLKCQDLKDLGFGDDEIAKMMGRNKSDIAKWISTLPLMKEYLEYYGYDEMYPMLEQLEDLFLTLNKALKDWRDRGALARNCNWEYRDIDVDDLKIVCFDYMRYGQEGKEFRRICKPGKEGAIFQDEGIWKSFQEVHFKAMNEVEEPSVDEVLAEYPNQDSIDVLKGRDARWKSNVEDRLKKNLKYNLSRLDDKIDDAKPREILTKIKDLLANIDTNKDGFYDDPEVAELVCDINRSTYHLKRLLGR